MKTFLLTLVTSISIYTLQAQTGNVGIGTTLPGSKLTLNGSFAAPYKIVSASAAVGANDFYLAYDGSSNGTLTLPAATAAAPAAGNMLGRTYHFKNTGTAILTIAANGTELIDNQSGTGVATITINPGYYAFFISKGTTGAVTTWEVAVVASSTPDQKGVIDYINGSSTLTLNEKHYTIISNGGTNTINLPLVGDVPARGRVYYFVNRSGNPLTFSRPISLMVGGTTTTMATGSGWMIQCDAGGNWQQIIQ